MTDSFLGLSSNVKGCNMEKTFENCTTKIYIDTLKQQCGCLPFNIHLSDKVQSLLTSLLFIIIFTGSSLLYWTIAMCKEYLCWQHCMSANVRGIDCDKLLQSRQSKGSWKVHLTCWQRLWQLQNICQIPSLNQRLNNNE